jgi:hypothetical protein
MKHYIKIIFFGVLFFGFIEDSNSQRKRPLSEVIQQVSSDWRKDSTSCNGYRHKIFKDVLDSQVDSTTKELLFSKLGKPNYIQRFYNGNTKKNYVSYIYFVYKDNCPKIEVDGLAIQFIFDESESHLVEISEIMYCG